MSWNRLAINRMLLYTLILIISKIDNTFEHSEIPMNIDDSDPNKYFPKQSETLNNENSTEDIETFNHSNAEEIVTIKDKTEKINETSETSESESEIVNSERYEDDMNESSINKSSSCEKLETKEMSPEHNMEIIGDKNDDLIDNRAICLLVDKDDNEINENFANVNNPSDEVEYNQEPSDEVEYNQEPSDKNLRDIPTSSEIHNILEITPFSETTYTSESEEKMDFEFNDLMTDTVDITEKKDLSSDMEYTRDSCSEPIPKEPLVSKSAPEIHEYSFLQSDTTSDILDTDETGESSDIETTDMETSEMDTSDTSSSESETELKLPYYTKLYDEESSGSSDSLLQYDDILNISSSEDSSLTKSSGKFSSLTKISKRLLPKRLMQTFFGNESFEEDDNESSYGEDKYSREIIQKQEIIIAQLRESKMKYKKAYYHLLENNPDEHAPILYRGTILPRDEVLVFLFASLVIILAGSIF
eukprot:TRINITY_DN3598_c0_g1_i2.p1 TRINITY_DN3598_c0_g1~~TRINITY_DN3598_c0_g1_i2.p1  ORF type:complete len:474 (-),score=128.86 TRINITY_DN3598_c0_g1_i2:48-1469(-)